MDCFPSRFLWWIPKYLYLFIGDYFESVWGEATVSLFAGRILLLLLWRLAQCCLLMAVSQLPKTACCRGGLPYGFCYCRGGAKTVRGRRHAMVVDRDDAVAVKSWKPRSISPVQAHPELLTGAQGA
ncbi:hypothetical protein U1Q18_024859 [Sarracenia purpurea var. burkii]